MAKRFYTTNGPIRTKNNAGIVKEAMNEPCGLPFGSRSVVLDAPMRGNMNSVKVNDLYEGVEKMMKEDASAARSMTKPHSW
jgi:hypothetical protein